MNIATVLMLPWRATRAPARWVMGLLYGASAIAAFLIGFFTKHTHDQLSDAAASLGFGTAYLWGFLLAQTLVLAADAHRMRLPGMVRAAALSLIIYTALFSLVPAAIFAAMGAPLLPYALLFFLCIVGGLVFAWSPSYVATLLALMPMTLIGSKYVLLPGVDSPDFIRWAAPAAWVGLAWALWRWHVIVRDCDEFNERRSRPMVLYLRRLDTRGGADWFGNADSSTAIRQRPQWQQAAADIRGTGPSAPQRSLRIMLGGWYAPRTLRGYLVSISQVGMLLLVFLVIGVSSKLKAGENFSALLSILWMPGLVSVAAYGTALVTVVCTTRLALRWRRVNAELPLMALMPGFGGPEETKRRLLRTALRLPVGVQLAMTALILAVVLYRGTDPAVLTAIVLSQLACIALVPMMILRIFGGRPLPTWLLNTGCIVIFVLINFNCVLPMTMIAGHAHTVVDTIAMVVGAIWSMVLLATVPLARTGWRALQQRPHAFLANPAA
ncbi:hypothetical protein [Dyella sp.]|uniref:hypothetical protein n=1 Tax=Dyella sp. TaxID=1869338 RepID=UPI002ED48474